MATENNTSSTTVIISGKNVFHEGSLNAKLKVLNAETCVVITDYEDVRGYLSADGETIDWEDGDCWRRVASSQDAMGGYGGHQSAGSCKMQERPKDQRYQEASNVSAVDALLQRDVQVP
ncbi:unnamed protein product [Symbiodinium pilosum]|uniref:Uncharacterized protein n=1 Tax=Symbiodinium pilosum TaxID=2952 RepID=A0A812Q120_SYMPI|nr:unnamed protein product [Symbiodinium pilosum]